MVVEKGVEATAATSVIVNEPSAATDVVSLQTERFFLFVIPDNETECILFGSRVLDPRGQPCTGSQVIPCIS